MTLTVSPASRFQHEGFALEPKPVLPMSLIERARAGIDSVRAGHYDTGRAPYASPWNPGDDPHILCKIELGHIANEALREVASHPAIGAQAAALTGATHVQVWWVQLLYKPPLTTPDAPTSVGWHQDYHYWQDDWASPDGLLTAWVALSDVTAESGPLRFVRGSHRWGLREDSDFFAHDPDAQRISLDIPDEAHWEEVEAVLPPGGVSFHDSLTYHGSGPNRANLPRCSLALHLCTDHARLREGGGALTRFLDEPGICPVLHSA